MKRWLTILFIVGWPSYWACVFWSLIHIRFGWFDLLPAGLSCIGTFVAGWILILHPAYNKKENGQ